MDFVQQRIYNLDFRVVATDIGQLAGLIEGFFHIVAAMDEQCGIAAVVNDHVRTAAARKA